MGLPDTTSRDDPGLAIGSGPPIVTSRRGARPSVWLALSGTMKALCFDRFGGPDVLEIRDIPAPALLPGTALVRMHAIGLNFADVYRRRGNYAIDGAPPYIAGYEGAGVVMAIDDAGTALRVGDRVGFADVPRANAAVVAAEVARLVPLPASISFETAAAALLQGLTAQYLVRDSHAVARGETVLVHAAAGGVGLLVVQLCKLLGARVFGLTSSAAKADAARRAGADDVLLYATDWVAEARARTSGRGVDVVYDSVGSTLDASLRALRTGGKAVFFGMAGGDPPPLDPRRLMDESKTVTGGDLWNVLATAADRTSRASELFSWIERGALSITISARFPLAQGAAAHAHLEGRGSIGKILLVPDP